MKILSIKISKFSFLGFSLTFLFLLLPGFSQGNFSSDSTFSLAQYNFPITQAKKHSGQKHIEINLNNQTLTMYENQKSVSSFIISSGKASMPTPRGNFQIYNKAPRAWSEKYGLYMPYWMAFTPSGAYGIHELPEWPSGYKEGAAHLGIPVSHGCVRLGVGPAKRLYDWAYIGMPVIIY